MSKQNRKHPSSQARQINLEDQSVLPTGQPHPDIQNEKNKQKRNSPPQQKGPEAELDWSKDEEEPVEEKSPDTSASL